MNLLGIIGVGLWAIGHGLRGVPQGNPAGSFIMMLGGVLIVLSPFV